eukprot:TRINITY_DN11851_c0_g1_i1.p1 TRINITY_DN11851_c0_g1~~TRINITY_DN11851_c0_g1_i1.p1  ORF type:complete len:169 (-),score=50.83 TRINITY_DN11851_c0_g1_i1:96-602(-)
MSASIRVNFHEECEAALNSQVNAELTAAYEYDVMSSYFDRHDVALPGFKKFFRDSAEEERGHAKKFAEYIQKRGGIATYNSILAPKTVIAAAKDAFVRALEMEKEILAKLTNLAEIADKHNDKQLDDFVVEMIEEQYESINTLGHLITKLQRAGPEGLGLYLFDKDLQ